LLRHRIIPLVLLDGYSVVKTIQFGVRRNLGNPIAVARIYNTRNVDELVLLDIDATAEGRRIDMSTIEDVASECFMPLCVGGGLRTIADIAEALARGADKVSLNSAALQTPDLISEASRSFGRQCIVLSVDAKCLPGGRKVVHSAGKCRPDSLVVDWCKRGEELGCGEILLNSVDHDGMMAGYDLSLVREVSAAVRIPVIAAGGAGKPEDMALAISEANASAVAAASIYHFTSHTPLTVKTHFVARGIPVRL
jgi:cyclase